MNIRSVLGGVAVGTFLSIALGACGASGDNLDQCQVDADCAALGLLQNICDTTQSPHVCKFQDKVVETPPAAVNCNTDDECVAKNGGRPAICPNPGQAPCVPLATDLCTVSGDWRNKNRIMVGSIWANDYDCISCSISSRGVKPGWELAMSELQQNLVGGGLPGGVNGARRPLVDISCEAAGRQDLSAIVANHLIDEVGVDAVQFFTGEDLGAVATRVAAHVAKGEPATYMISPGYYANARKAVSTILQDGSGIFITGGVADDVVPAAKTELERIKTEVAADPGFSGGPVRVGYIYLDDAYNAPPAQHLLSELSAANEAPTVTTTYKRRLVGIDGAISAIVAANPHVVILQGSVEVGRVVLPHLEAGGIHPRYLIIPQGAAAEEAIGGNEDLRHRLTNITAPFDESSWSLDQLIAFVQSYGAVNPTLDPFLAAFGYDEVYALAYAITASGDVTAPGRLPASRIADGFKKSNNVGQKVYYPGVGQMFDGISDAYLGKADFQGIFESFNFDDTIGASRGDVTVQCYARDFDGSMSGLPGSVVPVPSGRIYHNGATTPTGDVDCATAAP